MGVLRHPFSNYMEGAYLEGALNAKSPIPYRGKQRLLGELMGP